MSEVSCANFSGNICLTFTYDATYNLASSGASYGVSELHLNGRDKLFAPPIGAHPMSKQRDHRRPQRTLSDFGRGTIGTPLPYHWL